MLHHLGVVESWRDDGVSRRYIEQEDRERHDDQRGIVSVLIERLGFDHV